MPPDEEVPETPVETPETPETPAPETPVETPAETETFDRTYVEKLRQEAAEHRTKYAPYRDAFEGYDDESREALLDIARQIVESPRDAAKRMVEVAKGLTGEEFEKLLEDQGPQYLTAEDLDKQLSARQQKEQEEQAVKAVQSEAKTLGYEEGTAGYADLMFRAFNEHEGDLDAAHKAREAEKQEIISEYLKSKAAGNDNFPPVTADGSGAAGDGGPPKDFAGARAALTERLKASLG